MIIKCINMFSCHFTSMKSALKPCGPQLKLIPVGMKLGMKLGMKRPAVSLLSPEWDESPSQGPHSSPPPTPQNFIRLPQQFTYAHSYSWVERGTVRVQCFAKEHNTLTLPCLGPWPLQPESSTLYVTRVEQRETSELTCCDAYRSKVQFLKVSWSEFFSCFMPKKHFSSKSICYSTHSCSLQYINFSSQTYILRGNNIRIHTINVSVWVMTKNMLKIGS